MNVFRVYCLPNYYIDIYQMEDCLVWVQVAAGSSPAIYMENKVARVATIALKANCPKGWVSNTLFSDLKLSI